GQTKLLQLFAVELENHRLRLVEEAHLDTKILIGGVGVLEELRFRRNVGRKERAIGDIAFDLVRVRRPAPRRAAIFTAKPYQWADTGAAFMAHDVVGIILIKRLAVGIDETGQPKPCT